MDANAPTLTESVRIPLHELQADVDYLIGRVVADGSCAPMIAASIKTKLANLEAALPSLVGVKFTEDVARRIIADSLAVTDDARGRVICDQVALRKNIAEALAALPHTGQPQEGSVLEMKRLARDAMLSAAPASPRRAADAPPVIAEPKPTPIVAEQRQPEAK